MKRFFAIVCSVFLLVTAVHAEEVIPDDEAAPLPEAIDSVVDSVSDLVTSARMAAMNSPPYTRTSRLIRPTPRPTKATMTKVKMRGLEVIAPAKEPTHLTASVTREETLPTIVATVVVAS